MVGRFKDTGHPVFTSISALSRGILKKKINRDTVHFNADASNTEFLFLNHSFCESAQYLRSSFELVWTMRLDRGRKGTKRCIDKCEITRSEPFGIFSKTSIWKQSVGKHSRLRITVRDVHKGMRRRNFCASGFSWYELQNPTWRGRRFGAEGGRGRKLLGKVED